MTDVEALIERCAAHKLDHYACERHADQSAWGVCQECGRDFCHDCLRFHSSQAVCQDCERRFGILLSRLANWLRTPVGVLAGLIGAVALAWCLYPQSDPVSATNDPALKNEAFDRKAWLFLGKGVRLKTYADHLRKSELNSRAARVHARAALAFEEALIATADTAGLEIPDTVPGAEPTFRRRIARMLVAGAQCYELAGNQDAARKRLEAATKCDTEDSVSGLAWFHLARMCEQENPERAAGLYAKARRSRHEGIASFADRTVDNAMDLLGRPRDEAAANKLAMLAAGDFDAAEAQYRIVRCYEKLKLKEKAVEAREILLAEYPDSAWARKLPDSVRRPVPPDPAPRRPQEKEEPSPPKESDEELTIVPLED